MGSNHRTRFRHKRRDQLVSLKALIEVEIKMAKLFGGTAWMQDDYLVGRVKMGEFVLIAINDRLGVREE